MPTNPVRVLAVPAGARMREQQLGDRVRGGAANAGRGGDADDEPGAWRDADARRGHDAVTSPKTTLPNTTSITPHRSGHRASRMTSPRPRSLSWDSGRIRGWRLTGSCTSTRVQASLA